MRARNIKPGFFRNEQLMQVTPLGRLLFAGLWCLADREGRLLDRPNQIKWDVLPADDCDADALLDDLALRGFIRRYEADGKRCIEIPNFRRHQKPHPNEKAFALPPPPDTAPAQKQTSIRLNDEYMNVDSLNPDPRLSKRSKHVTALLLEDYRPPTAEDEALSRIAKHWQSLTGQLLGLEDRQHIRRFLGDSHSESVLIDLLTALGSTAQAKPLRLSSILAEQLAKLAAEKRISPKESEALPNTGSTSPNESEALPNAGNISPDESEALPSAGSTSPNESHALPNADDISPDESEALPNADGASPNESHASLHASAASPKHVSPSHTAATVSPVFFTAKDGNTKADAPTATTKPYLDWQKGFFAVRENTSPHTKEYPS